MYHTDKYSEQIAAAVVVTSYLVVVVVVVVNQVVIQSGYPNYYHDILQWH